MAPALFLFATIAVLAEASTFTHTKYKITATKSSSVLLEKGKAGSYYAAAKAFDKNIKTAWCAGSNKGVNSELTMQIKHKRKSASAALWILNGYGASRKLYEANSRLKKIEIKVTYHNGEARTQLEEFNELQSCQVRCDGKKCANKPCEFNLDADGLTDGGAVFYLDMPMSEIDNGWRIKAISVKILSLFPGKKYNDTCVAEMRLLQTTGH